LGPKPGLVLNDAALIDEVLNTRRSEFERVRARQVLSPLRTEHSLLTALQSQNWSALRQRDPMSQRWSADWCAKQVAPLTRTVTDLVHSMAGKPSVDLTAELRRLTFDAFVVSLVGESPPDSLYERFMWLSGVGNSRFKARVPLRFVSLPKGFEAARDSFFKYFSDRVEAARRKPNPTGMDLLSRTLSESPDFPDEALAHTLALCLPSGVFSSSSGLIAALHFLHRHPAAEGRTVAAAADFAGGPPTLARMNALPWIEAVILESMRLLPPVPLFTRAAVRDVQLAGVTLPSGATIMISNLYLHRDPEYWPDPDRFEPARWLDGGTARDPIGSGHYFPFGRGPRYCVGSEFAMVFMRTALAVIFANVKVLVQSPDPLEVSFFHGTTAPDGITATFVESPTCGLSPV
jgi:cytochrome P450